VTIDTLGGYPAWSRRRSIVVMTSSPNELIVTGRIEDRIRAAAHGRALRKLRRDARLLARPGAPRRRFRHRGPGRTSDTSRARPA
jgi:hypothetical protein